MRVRKRLTLMEVCVCCGALLYGFRVAYVPAHQNRFCARKKRHVFIFTFPLLLVCVCAFGSPGATPFSLYVLLAWPSLLLLPSDFF
jgi:hypothetical protein